MKVEDLTDADYDRHIRVTSTWDGLYRGDGLIWQFGALWVEDLPLDGDVQFVEP